MTSIIKFTALQGALDEGPLSYHLLVCQVDLISNVELKVKKKLDTLVDFVYCKKCKTMNGDDHEDCTQMLLVINVVSIWTVTC